MASIQKQTRRVRDPETGKIKEKNSYRVFIRLRGMKPITKTFSKKKLAEDFAKRIEGDQEAAEALGGKASALMRSMTLSELIDKYVRQYRGKDQSMASKLAWWKEHHGQRKLIAIDRNLILDGLEELAKGEGKRAHGRGRTVKTRGTGRPRSPATINRYKAALASVFKWGMGDKSLRLPSNPCRGVPGEPEPKGRIRFLSVDERRALLAACKQSTWSRLYLLVSMAITTGARKSELLRLTWDAIDLKTRRAFVAETKNGEPRVLPLTADVIQILMRFRKPRGLVFPSSKQPSQPMEFTKVWKQAMADAGIEDFRYHDLRHTCASYLAQNGATLLQIAEVLGHKQLEVTKRYSHLCVDHKQDLIDQIMGKVLEAGHV